MELEMAVTELAAEKAKEYRDAPERGLRVFVEGGGCAGIRYSFVIDEQRPDDIAGDRYGLRVLVDPVSNQYLHTATVDYVTGPDGEGFTVSNPAVQTTCGGCPGR